jgi:DNA-directed RNA polymerase specialized sigma24 family protein
MRIRGADAEVVAAVRTGGEAEFAALVEPHRAELLVHCYRLLGRYDDAKDLVQEAFARAWRWRGTFEGRASLRGWLYRIATNACLDARRRDRRRRRLSTTCPGSSRTRTVVSPLPISVTALSGAALPPRPAGEGGHGDGRCSQPSRSGGARAATRSR